MEKYRTNMCVRNALKECGVKQWELADALGISEATMTRMLRHELKDAEKEHFIKTIVKISSAKKRVDNELLL